MKSGEWCNRFSRYASPDAPFYPLIPNADKETRLKKIVYVQFVYFVAESIFIKLKSFISFVKTWIRKWCSSNFTIALDNANASMQFLEIYVSRVLFILCSILKSLLFVNALEQTHKHTLLFWQCMKLCAALFFLFFTFRPWNHCESVQDYLSIFDGKSSEFPELARICGGDSLPDIISSGPDMLIVFQTSAFDSLFHPTPVSYLLGFELQVEVSNWFSRFGFFSIFFLYFWPTNEKTHLFQFPVIDSILGNVCECQLANVYASAKPMRIHFERIRKCIGWIGQSEAYIATEYSVPLPFPRSAPWDRLANIY